MSPRALLLLLPALPALADPPIAIETHADEAPGDTNVAPRLLEFNPGFELVPEDYASETARLRLGSRAELHLTGSWREVSPQRWRDNDLVRGWRASMGGSYDFGWARVHADATYHHVENELGRGSVVDAAIGVTKTFRIARDVTGFVSLSLGHRRWLDKPLPGEPAAATQLKLSAGFRWK